MGRLYSSTTSSGGRLYSKSTPTTTTSPLQQMADESGYGEEVRKILNPTPKLSFLQRLGKGLGAFNPAEAILTGVEKKSVGAGIKNYLEGIGKGTVSAITGKDYEGTRRGFKDVAKAVGIENKIAQFGIGFLGDVLLDPSTYFGGAAAKAALGATKSAAGASVRAIGKVAPKAEAGINLIGQGAKDAFGKAFKYGYGTSEGLVTKAASIEGKLSDAQKGLASSNLARLGTGVLSKSQSEEVFEKLLAGKKAEYALGKGTEEGITAGKAVAKSTDPLVQKTIEETTKRSQKFAKAGGIEDPFAVYLPGIRKEAEEKLLKAGGTRSLKIGSQDYLKKYKDLLSNDEMLKDLPNLFFKREYAIVKDNIVKNQLDDIIKEFGKGVKEFATEDDALKAGYSLVKSKGKGIGYLLEADKKFINNLVSPEFSTIDILAKATGFDAVTSLFKRSVTGLFAPFHVRNWVSGNIQNFEVLGIDALNPANMATGMKMAKMIAKGEKMTDQIINIGGKQINMSKMFNAFKDRFGTSSRYMSDWESITKGLTMEGKILSKETLKQTVKTGLLGQEAAHFRVARVVGNFIETQQKATAYVTALKQGKNINEALKLAEVAGFDYRALTQFESKIMRRIIPFYAFTRKNIELQLKTLGTEPQRINQILKLVTNIGEPISAEERKSLPDYLQESLGIKIGDTPTGLKQYISSFGTPIEAFTDLLGKNKILKAISMTNPIMKTPIEIGIGKDSFREKDLKDVYTANEYAKAPKIVKDLLDIKEVTKPILKNINGELVKVGERIEYQADPIRLLIARSLPSSRGATYLSQAFGGDLKGLLKAIKLTTGLKPQQVDIEAQKAIKTNAEERAAEDVLIKAGELKRFERTYVPKGK
jgi:hypothetical protein